MPFGAIQLAIFELIKSFILNSPDIDFDSSTLLTEAIIGAFAGGVGALLTNPFDILTTRIITQTPNEGDKPLGIIGMGRRVYEESGVQAFAVGWEARGERIFANLFFWTSDETSLHLLVGYWAPAISIFLSVYCSVRQAGVVNNWFPTD